MKKLLVLVVLLASFSGLFAEFHEGQVGRLYAASDKFYFYLKNDNCSSSSYYYYIDLASTTDGEKNMVALLISAANKGMSVRVAHSSCPVSSTSHIQISYLYVNY